MSSIWLNHRSHPIFGTNFYRWVLWIEGDDQDLEQVSSVKYNLHPTFERGYAESSDRGFNFRIDARGWGSFYIDARIRFKAGFEEQISYFLDVEQFFQRKTPKKPKRYVEQGNKQPRPEDVVLIKPPERGRKLASREGKLELSPGFF
jgi:transcription initiation factor IIF auxiliary subunit